MLSRLNTFQFSFYQGIQLINFFNVYFYFDGFEDARLFGCFDKDQRLEFGQSFLANAAYLGQVFNPPECAVLAPIGDDTLGHLGANAGQAIQLASRGGINVHPRERQSLDAWLRHSLRVSHDRGDEDLCLLRVTGG
eukprot:TRINITY_DN7770_c1_g1_i3.p2 TRINITY_DN7770_c1_g1~~TRINITY_DN7770_c1_g1_i3.p2  ORF type:complete len:136 (+),score=1.92 TRINITY_DN7770_c1_g1_i3:250-657(+)